MKACVHANLNNGVGDLFSCPLVSFYDILNITAYLRIITHHVYLFMTRVQLFFDVWITQYVTKITSNCFLEHHELLEY